MIVITTRISHTTVKMTELVLGMFVARQVTAVWQLVIVSVTKKIQTNNSKSIIPIFGTLTLTSCPRMC